jgi:NAD(P)-dependent dehydrogenase (short-subunit alcohol dehydrogenase family)
MGHLDGKVAAVTGAGGGLGQSYALALALEGAAVVVNDIATGVGGDSRPADQTVQLIIDQGGKAVSNYDDISTVAGGQSLLNNALKHFDRIDILVNNAGILRDKSFVKMGMDDFKLVVDVHLMGSANCSKAVWALMREQGYGRIVMTTSSSGMYGNFGQANYGAAKMAVVGLMNTLCIEGEKYNVKVNCLSPTAGTRMLEGLVTEEQSEIMTVESVTAGLLTLCDTDAPNRSILCAGAGGYARTHIYETDGIYLPPEAQTAENVRAHMDAIDNPEGEQVLIGGFQQTNKFVAKAAAYREEQK